MVNPDKNLDLVDILSNIRKDRLLETSGQKAFYNMANRSPFRYEIEFMDQNERTLKLGKDTIPHKDQITDFQVNEFYRLVGEGFQKRYPEFEEASVVAIIEQVKDVKFEELPSSIIISSDRYLVRQI